MVTKQYERYANAMMMWGYGYGFSRPATDADARPGVCGYVDDSGIWQKVVDLNDGTTMTSLKLDKLELPQLKPSSQVSWGPKFTNTVKETEVKAEANVSLSSLGLPVDCSTVFDYRLSSDFGAVLVCNDMVEVSGYPHKDSFRVWARANANRLLQICPDIATYGFYVMTTTWSARDIHINTWTSKENTITIGVKTGVKEGGAAGQTNEYYRGRSGSGWEHPEVTGDERKVLFFGGLKFKFNKLFRRFNEYEQAVWDGYLGEDTGNFLVEDNEDAYEVKMSFV